MKDKLNKIILQETITVRALLLELEEQHRCIIVSDVFGMEACVNKIKEANKNIAFIEVERRKLTENRAMTEIIEEARWAELESNYHKIKLLLHEVMQQKDTNELLLRQGLRFTNKMLNVLSPVRETVTYNSYGKVKK